MGMIVDWGSGALHLKEMAGDCWRYFVRALSSPVHDSVHSAVNPGWNPWDEPAEACLPDREGHTSMEAGPA